MVTVPVGSDGRVNLFSGFGGPTVCEGARVFRDRDVGWDDVQL
jgi:hypothetical protein